MGQHKDSSKTRITQDYFDGYKILSYLKERDPFATRDNLVNLATGEVADDTVNAQLAQDIGEKQVISMSGPNVFDFSFKKKDMVITMKTKSVMSIDGESVHVDSTLLFERLIAVYR